MMVAYAYHIIDRVNPVGFFGMVHVLEGTSVAIATQVADAVQPALGLPTRAFRYLRSHGALDKEHVDFYETLINSIEDKEALEDYLILESTGPVRIPASLA